MGVKSAQQRTDEAAAASAVLTNRALLSLTVSFLDGLPRWALDFARRHEAIAQRHWHCSGLLPVVAIAVEDFVMLARLYQLYEEQRAYQRQFQRLSPDSRLAFDSAMTFAARNGHIAALEWLQEHTKVRCDPQTLVFAATMGRLDVVQWLAANCKEACASVSTSPCDAIVLAGNLALVQFVTTRFPAIFLTTDAMDYAAAHGYFDVLQYLHGTRVEGCTSAAMDHAARCGRLDMVRFLHEQRTEGCTTDAVDFAAANGHLDVVQFLHAHRTEGCTRSAMDEAARNGHLSVVQFLHANRSEGCTAFALDMAAARGHVDVIRFLLAHRRELCTPMALLAAAEAGHLEVVRLLHQLDTCARNCSGDVLHAAARCGHVDLVAFLVDNCSKGCLVTARECAEAAGQPKTAEMLTRYTRHDAHPCGEASHEWDAKRRRCQVEAARVKEKTSGSAAAW